MTSNVSPTAATAACMAAAASGLLSSMPISTRFGCRGRGNADAAHHFLGAFAHQQVVAGDEGLAFGAVDHQFPSAPSSRRSACRGWEDGAAEADDAGLLQAFAHLFRCQRR